MPLGDSITYDNDLRDCENPRPVGDRIAYRFHLYELLHTANYKFTFVGNRNAGEHFFPQPQNAGFPGCTAKQLCEVLRSGYNGFEKKQEVEGEYLPLFRPDVILLHIGSNHIDKTLPEDIDEVLSVISRYNGQKDGRPTVTFVARIIDYNVHNPHVSRLNTAVDAIVKWRIALGEPLVRVDMESALDYRLDMADIYHPNPVGYVKIAERWFHALEGYLKKRS